MRTISLSDRGHVGILSYALKKGFVMQNETALRALATALIMACDHKPLLKLADLAAHFGATELAESLVNHAEDYFDTVLKEAPALQPHDAYLNQCAALFGLPSWQAAD